MCSSLQKFSNISTYLNDLNSYLSAQFPVFVRTPLGWAEILHGFRKYH